MRSVTVMCGGNTDVLASGSFFNKTTEYTDDNEYLEEYNFGGTEEYEDENLYEENSSSLGFPDIHGIIVQYNLEELQELANEWGDKMRPLTNDRENLYVINVVYDEEDNCYKGTDTKTEDGYTYIGYELDDNKPSGVGVLYYGDIVEDWQNVLHADRIVPKFMGEFIDGKPENMGLESFCENEGGVSGTDTVFTFGEFKNGLLDGEGMFICWQNDVQCYLCGEFKDGAADGEMTMYTSDAIIFEGTMKDGCPCGKGKEYYGDGSLRYEGEFKDGLYDGEGTLYDEYGEEIYSGKWKEGEYVS